MKLSMIPSASPSIRKSAAAYICGLGIRSADGDRLAMGVGEADQSQSVRLLEQYATGHDEISHSEMARDVAPSRHVMPLGNLVVGVSPGIQWMRLARLLPRRADRFDAMQNTFRAIQGGKGGPGM
jgi:hypothetical protein